MEEWGLQLVSCVLLSIRSPIIDILHRYPSAVLLDWKPILLELLSSEVLDRCTSRAWFHGNGPGSMYGHCEAPSHGRSPRFGGNCWRTFRHHLHDWTGFLGHINSRLPGLQDILQFYHGVVSLPCLV